MCSPAPGHLHRPWGICTNAEFSPMSLTLLTFCLPPQLLPGTFLLLLFIVWLLGSCLLQVWYSMPE